MGEVFLAVARGVAGFTKLVVLKRARPDLTDEPDFLTMFLDEARLAARLNHPNVVQTYEAGQEAGRYFIAMEYLDGQPLHRIRSRVGPREFPLSMQVRILIETLAGLHYAHELTDFDGTSLGVIHRDATPQNIFVTYDGQIKVVDFGIAKAASSTTKTRTGMLKGKVSYLAPEQARGEPLDRRVDVFAVGVMLWEALVGERMWKDVPTTEIIRRLAAGKLPGLPAEVASNAPKLAQICARALAPMPADRYATAAELQHELERWLAQRPVDATGRSIGTFVATHFEERRATIKALLEDELRDYASSARPNVGNAHLFSPDLAPSLVDNDAPSSRSFSASSQAAVPATTAGEGSPPAIKSVTAGEGSPPAVTITMRSSVPGDAPPVAPTSPSSPEEDQEATRTLDKKRVSPVPPSVPAPVPPPVERPETREGASVSLTSAEEPRSASRSPRRRRRSLGIASAGLIAGAVGVVALTVGLPAAWIERLPLMRPGSTASANATLSGNAAPAAPAPAGEVELTIRVSPATARIFVDGTPVATGSYKDKLAKDGRVHSIRAEAPSFVTMEQPFTANSDVFISLALERESAAAP